MAKQEVNVSNFPRTIGHVFYSEALFFISFISAAGNEGILMDLCRHIIKINCLVAIFKLNSLRFCPQIIYKTSRVVQF